MSRAVQPSLTSYTSLFLTYLGPQWRRVTLMAALIFTGIGLQLINPQILRFFIDAFTSGSSHANLALAGALFVGIALAIQAVTVLATYLSENVAWTATNTLRSDLVAHCLTLDMAFHKAHTPGELIERIDGDVDTLSNFFSQAVIHLFGNSLLILGVLILFFVADWRIGLVMAAFALLALAILLVIRKYALRHFNAYFQMNADFYAFLGEQLAGTEDMRANGATGYVMGRFYRLLRHRLPPSRRAVMSIYAMVITTILVFAIGNAIAFVLGAYLWSVHAITIGTVYIIFYYTNLMIFPMEQIRVQLQDLQGAGAGLQRVQELLHTQPAINDGVGTPLPAGALAIDFDDVTFGYQADQPVLHQVDFHVRAGTKLGVLGRTGSGKTSLARLILRLYDPQLGQVRIGEVPLRELRLHDLRHAVGMVTQDVQLFHATVRDNLTFFNAAISDARIVEALEDLGLSTWYRSLPHGLDTELGSDGEGLSAGEAQLLAFTRVFLANPGLVILDEATSRLDPVTERLIEHAMDKLFAGRTGIIIAHRLSTVERADDILVLQDGCMQEYGPRTTLASDVSSRFYHLLQTGLEEILA